MIEPNMATMLAFILTDAAIGRELLQTALRRAARGTFNAISVDGAMSTNDTVLALANGRAAAIEETDQPAWKGFCAALEAVCASLARKIVADGECISKVITLEVSGAPSDAGAEAVARRIANSMLTKSAWYGSDPNWGRVACDVGAAGVALDPNRLTIAYDGVRVCADGGPLPAAMPAAAEVCARPAFTISVGLGAGPGRFRLLTTDLTEAYVAFNMSE
jgi:glutamate N-acetyltransferase/amino-acid N-acetyltransferase